MNAPHRPKVAGFKPAFSPPQQTAPPSSDAVPPDPSGPPDASGPAGAAASDARAEQAERFAAVQDRLTDRISDLTTLQELNERLARTAVLDDALQETLRAGAVLVGARRGLLALEPWGHPRTEPGGSSGPEHTVGLGLGRADIGQLETVPRASSSYGRLLDGERSAAAHRAAATGEPPDDAAGRPPGPGTPAPPGAAHAGATDHIHAGAADAPHAGTHDHAHAGATEHPGHAHPGTAEIAHPDIATDDTLDPRHREVAARLGYAASYATPLTTETAPGIGAAVWLYDEPAEPTPRQRQLLGLYLRCATEHIARHIELARAREDAATLHEELLPSRLPRTQGVTLARRHRTGPRGGGDWYDALQLPEGALGLAVGGVAGSGPGAVAAMGRLRASLRAYAVMEGEDPVAVLSDLELLMRLTEPQRSATALFAYVEPALRRVLLAGAGHCPPLIVGPHRIEYVETTLSAPLGMLACWEAPSVEVTLRPGETLLLYSDGLLHRTGEEMDRAFARLYAAAACAPPPTRDDPEALADHVLHATLPEGRADQRDHPEDVVLLAARF